MNTEILDTISIDLNIIRTLDQKFIKQVITGQLECYLVKSYEQYDDIFRIRHDSIHWLICQERGVIFGERPISEFKEFEIVKQHKYYEMIYKQTPDIIVINKKDVLITEISISQSRTMHKEKVTKYSLLTQVLIESGFNVKLEVIIFSLITSIPDRNSLKLEHKFDDPLIDKIYEIIRNVQHITSQIETTPIGQEWFMRRRGEVFSDVDLNVSPDEIRNYFNQSETKVFPDNKSLEDHLTISHDFDPSELTDEESKFMDFVCDLTTDMKPTLNKSDNFSDAINKTVEYHAKHANSQVKRSFFPLPYLQNWEIDSQDRSTWGDEDYMLEIRAAMRETEDPILSKLCNEVIKFNDTDKKQLALDGPGRKKYVKQKSSSHIKEGSKNNKIWFDFQTPHYNNELDDLLIWLSKIEVKDLQDEITDLNSTGLRYVKCCQTVFRELSLNVMRKDRRHKYLFKPTGIKGVIIIIYPGPKLRAGESVSIVWFKLVTMRRNIDDNEFARHWAFKRWNINGMIAHSNWISADANRIDHYLRAYDKITMAYLSYMHFGPGHIEHNIMKDKSDTLGTIIAIYLEDKRSTSKMLQDVRYLVMSSLSMFRYHESILDKYREPIRTPFQGLMLMRILNYSKDLSLNLGNYLNDCVFGKAQHDSSFDTVSDKLAGAKILLPRVLTKGSKINFQQILCEMYFTMLFNKNQDDPTHSTFQILNKMLDGEDSLEEVKKTTQLHMGGSNMFDDARTLVEKPHKNQFSKFAIIIGSKLQSLGKYNKAVAGLSHRKAAQNKFINKPISEYATYKSSSTSEVKVLTDDILTKKRVMKTNKYADKLEEKYLEYKDDDDESQEEVRWTRINPRRRCIEGVISLLKENKMYAFDIINDNKLADLYFQVFKKNQIGGVREILILPIDKRITINILESFSRLICRDDEREMLTHGDLKLTTMRDLLRDLRRAPEKRIIMNYNLDKTRWGPSFMPIQFLYMFYPFRQYYPSLYRFIMITLMSHSNKKCLIPENLIKVWLNDISNKKKHKEQNLQQLKEHFLETKQLWYLNESNMGQGILHYTSSLLHLCALSFRDNIYSRLCKRNGLSEGEWRDLVSSDDSYTAQSIPTDSKVNVIARINLFIKSQEITERLFNIWTSKSKSSISLLINEFNSMFGSNLTLFPTLLKFCISSVNPMNTDSFFRMVKESYSTSRQIVENGGSMELYLCAQRLNKVYCESMYHTNEGGYNSFDKFGLNRNHVPYHLGVFPIGDPSMMIMLGPEWHNYRIIDCISNLSEKELKLLNSSHTVLDINNPEIYAEMNSFDNLFSGLLRIEAALGAVKKLSRIKRQIDMSWEDMFSILQKDFLLMFRSPSNIVECKIRTYLKLFQFGSSEALRNTAACIYYARVSATVSGKAFKVPHTELQATYSKKENRMIGYDYKECLEFMLNKESTMIDYKKFYPYMSQYQNMKHLKHTNLVYSKRDELETQNIRTLQLNEVTSRVKNQILDLLTHFWVGSMTDHPTSYLRDWITLKELVPVIGDTFTQTMDNFGGPDEKRRQSLMLVLLRLMSHSSKPMKAVVFGTSSRSYDTTFLTLSQNNMYYRYTNSDLLTIDNSENDPRVFDDLYHTFNAFALSTFIGNTIDVSDKLDRAVCESFCRDQFATPGLKKKIMIMLLYTNMIDDIKTWTDTTKTIMYDWIKPQKMVNNVWVGDFVIKLQCGINIMMIEGNSSFINVKMSTALRPAINYDLLNTGLGLLQLTVADYLARTLKGHFLIIGEKIIMTTQNDGVKIQIVEMSNILFRPSNFVIERINDIEYFVLYDELGFIIMKTPVGLIATDYREEKEKFDDFLINGVSFNNMTKMGIFSNNFSFDYLRYQDMLDLLTDLDVTKPKITKVTYQRLKGLIDNSWQIKGEADVMADVEEAKFMEVFDPREMIDELKAVPIEDLILAQSQLDTDVSIYDQLLNPEFDFNLISSLSVVRTKFQPAILWERILNLKYNLIARCCMPINMICRQSIKMVYSHTLRKELVYSLIYVYDKLFTNLKSLSPSSIGVQMNPEFVEKFNLASDDDYGIN